MENRQYICPKCGCMQYESDQFQATGGNLAKFFDVQNKKFITISCVQCALYGTVPGGDFYRYERVGLFHWKLSHEPVVLLKENRDRDIWSSSRRAAPCPGPKGGGAGGEGLPCFWEYW